MRGLTSSRRCPECGQAFDPADRGSFYDGAVQRLSSIRRWWIAQNGTPTVVWALVALLTCFFLIAAWQHQSESRLLIFFTSLLVASVVRQQAHRLAMRRYPALAPPLARYKTPRRIMWGLFLFATLMLSRDSYTCVHGTLMTFGGVAGISHSEAGGPCHQYRNVTAVHVIGNWYFCWI